jgi:hypothetical protein
VQAMLKIISQSAPVRQAEATGLRRPNSMGQVDLLSGQPGCVGILLATGVSLSPGSTRSQNSPACRNRRGRGGSRHPEAALAYGLCRDDPRVGCRSSYGRRCR